MIEAGFPTLLGGLAPVYPGHVPEKTSLPAIVYRRISTTGNVTHDGPSSLGALAFQFTCVASSHEAALNTAISVSELLKVYSGVVGTQTVAFCQITNIIDLGAFPEMGSWQVAVDATFQTE